MLDNVKSKTVNVKFTLYQAHEDQNRLEVYLYSFFNLGARWGWVVNVTPQPFTPGMTRYAWYRRLGEPQGQSGRVRKISPPTGIDLRTVQPLASRYTD